MDGKETMPFEVYLKQIHKGLMKSTWHYTGEQAKNHMDMEIDSM